jgi:hypothetical protein
MELSKVTGEESKKAPTRRVLSLGASLQQQSFYFILTQNLNQSFGKKERN